MRRRLTGVVTSNKMQKTVVVEVSRTYQHPLYHKVVRSFHKVKAHDELACEVGDTVQVVESRPISAQTRFVVESIVRRAVEPEVMADEPVTASYQTEVLDAIEEEDITEAAEATDTIEETDVVEETEEADAVEETDEADAVEETDEADAVEETHEADAVEETHEADTAEETDAVDSADEADEAEDSEEGQGA